MVKGNCNIGTFNVRGLTYQQKQDFLAQDVDKYNLDICCLQKVKIQDGVDCNIGEQERRFIYFKADCRHYGNGFIVSAK